MRLVIALGAALMMALGGRAAWAAPATSSTASFEVPLSGTVVNPCNGEAVAWQGTAHFVEHQTLTPTGRDVISGSVDFQGISGQGSLGNAYRVANTVTFELSQSGATQQEFTTTATFLFLSQGPAPNFTDHITYHVTVDDSGEPAATVVDGASECRG